MRKFAVSAAITQRLIDHNNVEILSMINRQLDDALRRAGCIPPYKYKWVYHPEPFDGLADDGSHMMVYVSGKAPDILDVVQEMTRATPQS